MFFLFSHIYILIFFLVPERTPTKTKSRIKQNFENVENIVKFLAVLKDIQLQCQKFQVTYKTGSVPVKMLRPKKMDWEVPHRWKREQVLTRMLGSRR